MGDEPRSDLLIRADACYQGVVADTATFGPLASTLVAEARTRRDDEALVAALRADAWYARIRVAHERAIALLNEAVRVSRKRGFTTRLGDVLVTRGAVHHEMGKLVAAARDFDAAEKLVVPTAMFELLAQRAILAQNRGRLADAARAYRKVLANPDVPAEVRWKTANNLGLIEAQCGHMADALALMDVAEIAAEQVGPAVVAIVKEGRAWVSVQAGRLSEGIRLFDEAAGLWEQAGLSLAEFHMEYADVLIDLRLVPEALREAQQAFAMFDGEGVQLLAAETQMRLARLFLLDGDAAGADQAASEAARRLREQRRGSWAARADLVGVDARLQQDVSRAQDLTVARRAAATLERAHLVSVAVEAHLTAGRVAGRLRRPGVAVQSFERAHHLSRGGPLLVRLRGHTAAALAAELRHDPRGISRYARAALDDLERHRSSLASQELRALTSEYGVAAGRLGLATAVREGNAPRVLDWMERTRAAALAAVDDVPEAEGVAEELGALRAVQAELREARRVTGTEPPALLERQARLEQRLRRLTWGQGRSGRASSRTWSPAQMRRRLNGRVLVEYDVLDDEVIAAILEPRRSRLIALGPVAHVATEIDALLFALRRLTRNGSDSSLRSARSSAELSLRRLHDLLIQPLALDRDAGLVVVPVDVLQRVPWGSLHDGPVTIAPSASLWARTADDVTPRRPSTALIAGPELEGAAEEIAALHRLHPDATVLTPPDSTVDAVVSSLVQADLAHLACHGTVRADNPIFSSLLFSDGTLTVHELDLRGLAPRRIILAACQSGTETTFAGNETLGFVSALLARGTAGLVASGVVVPDRDVVPLMQGLHEQLVQGHRLADALCIARGSVDREDPRMFVGWCAFNAYGAA
jgi:tetratricopeptide (TPR) repeat protein